MLEICLVASVILISWLSDFSLSHCSFQKALYPDLGVAAAAEPVSTLPVPLFPFVDLPLLATSELPVAPTDCALPVDIAFPLELTLPVKATLRGFCFVSSLTLRLEGFVPPVLAARKAAVLAAGALLLVPPDCIPSSELLPALLLPVSSTALAPDLSSAVGLLPYFLS